MSEDNPVSADNQVSEGNPESESKPAGESKPEGETEKQAASATSQSFWAAYVDQLKETITNPEAFFKSMSVAGGYKEPAVFLAITSAIHAVPSAIIHGNPLGVVMEFFGGFLFFVIMSGVLFGLCKKFKGEGTFQGTFRVVAFASGPKVITWLPWIGWIFGLYSIYQMVLGLQAVHKLSGKKASIVVAIPVTDLFVFSMIVSSIAKMIVMPRPH